MDSRKAADKIKQSGSRPADPGERCLVRLLEYSLKQRVPEQWDFLQGVDAQKLFALAQAHAVVPLICGTWCAYPGLDEPMRDMLQKQTAQAVVHAYRLLFYTKYLVGILQDEGIGAAVLKGAATAEFFPEPELRKSGDVDLLLFSDEDTDRAVACLERHGFAENGPRLHLHHVCMIGRANIEVELHRMMVEPFDNQATNEQVMKCMEAARRSVRTQACMGVPLPVLTGAYHGFELLLHLLQHFLTAGFGLKLLCDWVVFWEKQPREEAEEALRLIRALKVEQFAAAVTALCVRELGMDEAAAEPFLTPGAASVKSDIDLDALLREISDAEEFGKSEKGRMVAIHGSGIFAYVRAFHHQMSLNYPRAGKCPLLWPLLWVLTLLRFLHNNRTLRKTTVAEVVRSAGQRGRLVERLHLFE